MSDAEDRKEAKAVLKRLKDIPKNKLTVTQQANKTEALGILSGRDTEQETYRPTMRNKKEGGKVMAKEYPVKKKRHGGMTHVGLSPAEEARAGTMSEAGRARYMAKGGKVKTAAPKSTAAKKEAAERRRDKIRLRQSERFMMNLLPEVEEIEQKHILKEGKKPKPKKPTHKRLYEGMVPLERKAMKGGQVGNKKSQGKRISNKETDGSKLVDSLYD
tara:strand:- start:399 stop:1046 length:648 start_codon:yes stop_codon:yes gene_type:complete